MLKFFILIHLKWYIHLQIHRHQYLQNHFHHLNHPNFLKIFSTWIINLLSVLFPLLSNFYIFNSNSVIQFTYHLIPFPQYLFPHHPSFLPLPHLPRFLHFHPYFLRYLKNLWLIWNPLRISLQTLRMMVQRKALCLQFG